MRSYLRVSGLIALSAIALSGCESTRNSLGLNKVVPDEFRVVSKAPLVVPPNYALRPPLPGEPRPQELQPDSAAREALLGQRAAINRSEGEKLFTARAGAENADPLARYVVDDEFGDLAYKEKSFADRVMFWKPEKKAPVDPNVAMTKEAANVDAALEAEQLQTLTGGQKIIIQQKKERKFKLPGL
jgi:Protein of unknown function (DUF3035)